MPTLPTTMLAAAHHGFGDPEVLQPTTMPLPSLRPNDLLVRVRAAGLNRAEMNWRQGKYGAQPGFGDSDAVIGLEMAGEVVAIGPEAQGFSIGDRVMGIVGGGAYAEYARIDAGMAMHTPDNLSDEEAACIPEAMVTAHHVLLHLGEMQPGARVLVHGAGGGVGTSLMQMARMAGARTIVTTSSAGKHERLRELGADITIDYASQDFAEVIARDVPGGRVDVVICNMGAPYLERNLRSLEAGGRLIQLGLQGGAQGSLPMDVLMTRRLRIEGTVMKSLTPAQKAAMTQRFAQRWLPVIAQRQLLPLIERSYPLREAAQAHRHFEQQQPFGKLLLRC
ncbi:NAD(P)H-quinone oxidoreductase [Comamonas aquatica]|uniref:NAD(P)H-quinone oxidoreductase n=1 Tax=Comamonas aquatica TaxID=225991 RepID=UPI00244D4E26|nr:NAD(P)H-quinone oxidoreductase [Comamonas aquatica]MDH0897968.1 NAD(P)H-quinone oxidoreductase [Comamonas aquatica]MDH1378363.1 NAD(P)H-quinone oxidoreductase [Comamonas aquatica]MDH1638365.1 NAD(P)H-quinone oxidoreductase [Comamonas aquatica]MDH1813798.1 NAD(P)H-quinone oxidoreductase [Comamonas aquatica]